MLSTHEWEELNSIIILLHKKISEKKLRTQFLEQLKHLMDFSLGEFTIGRFSKNGHPILSDPVIISNYNKSFEKQFIYQYENIYSSKDYIGWLFHSTESIVYKETDLINNSVRANTPFYREYLQPFGLVYAAGTIICSDKQIIASIALYNNESKGDFTEKDLYILKQLLPHIQSVFEDIVYNSKRLDVTDSYILKDQYLLTNRELEIIGYIYSGTINSDIAAYLNISLSTVKKHIYNIYQKLEISNRVQLVNFINENNLQEIFDPD